MTQMRRGIRWNVLAGCLAVAVAWDFFYLQASELLDPEHRFALWLAEAPKWIRWLHLWTPSLISARLLNAFGFRFDIEHYDENNGFVLVSTVLTWAIWTAILYALSILVRHRSERNAERAAA